MKKVVLAVMLLILSGAYTTLTAQEKSNGKKEKSMKMPAGVMMQHDKMMVCDGHQCLPMTDTYTCSDGCTVGKDGTITMTNGKTMKLKNGQGLGKDGKMMSMAKIKGGAASM